MRCPCLISASSVKSAVNSKPKAYEPLAHKSLITTGQLERMTFLSHACSITTLKDCRATVCCFLIFFLATVSSAQHTTTPQFPKREVRGVWLTTVNGADWPKPEFMGNVAAQESSLVAILETLKKANMNTVLFQVRPRGNAFYCSSYEPWSAELTGTLGQNPEWDPLQFALQEAHSRGFELHAWFNVYKVWSGSTPPPFSTPQHIVNAHREWAQVYESEWWLDPGIPEVREYLVNVALDLVSRYDLDGIHFDYMRYPSVRFEDDGTYRRHGNGMDRDDWRRENINNFVREIYDKTTQIKPMLKVGSAPIGVYQNGSGASLALEGYGAVFQDAREWLREGKNDYIAPQIYWDIGNAPGDPDFAALVNDWQKSSYGRHVYAGVAAYKDKVRAELQTEIDTTRALGALGNVFFRYEHIENTAVLGGRYKYPALIPPMPWKDSIPPYPPTHLAVNQIGDVVFQLRWNMPSAAPDSDMPRCFNIYRSTTSPVDIENPASLVSITIRSDTTYIDRVSNPVFPQYYYLVTALDKGNLESKSSNEAQAIATPLADMTARFAPRLVLGKNYPNPVSRLALIGYELQDSSHVSLTVFDSAGRRVRTLTYEKQAPGICVVLLDVADLPSGTYDYILTVGSATITRKLDIQ